MLANNNDVFQIPAGKYLSTATNDPDVQRLCFAMKACPSTTSRVPWLPLSVLTVHSASSGGRHDGRVTVSWWLQSFVARSGIFHLTSNCPLSALRCF